MAGRNILIILNLQTFLRKTHIFGDLEQPTFKSKTWAGYGLEVTRAAHNLGCEVRCCS